MSPNSSKHAASNIHATLSLIERDNGLFHQYVLGCNFEVGIIIPIDPIGYSSLHFIAICAAALEVESTSELLA